MEEHDEQETETGAPDELEALRTELEVARAGERAAVARLKTALMASEPALEESLISGETVAEVEASFAVARALVSRIRERAATESATRVPPGAPGRLNSQPRNAFEKIRDGLGRGA